MDLEYEKYGLPAPQDGGYTYKVLEGCLTPYEVDRFNKWYGCQTCTSNKEGEIVLYSHDVFRGLDFIREGIPTYWD